MTNDIDSRYRLLHDALMAAFGQASEGKGRERHANGLPFERQPILEITRMVGAGFPLGQVMKKAQEAQGMAKRGEFSHARGECLGIINYAAAAVIWLSEQETK